MALPELQRRFLDVVLGHAVAPEDWADGTGRLSPDRQWQIYCDAYRLRMREALGDSFPAVHTLVGDEAFARLCDQYLAAHPSRHFSIRFHGAFLADFLATDSVYAAMPVLAEMARFEWTLRDVFDAADGCQLDALALADVEATAWPTIRFGVNPHVRCLDLKWNIPALWAAIDEGAAPIQPSRSDEAVRWLVWRKDLSTFYRSLALDEAAIIDAIGCGENFTALCERMLEYRSAEDAAARVATLLRGLVLDGVLGELIVTPQIDTAN